MIERLSVDIRSAVRALRAAPGAVAWAIVLLAVAVGLNLGMVGLIDRALLSAPAHVVDPARVFALAFEPARDEGGRARMTTTSYVAFANIRANVSAASDVAAWQRASAAVVIDSNQVEADAMLVSGGYFDLLGAIPEFGRAIRPDDDVPSGSAPAVLSHAFWTARCGADPGVIGRPIVVRGIEFTVAGVMPPGFSGHSAARVDVWLPFTAAMQETPGWQSNPFRNFASIVMRVKRDASVAAAAEQATAALDAHDRRVALTPIAGASIGTTERRIAFWLTGISALVLVIGLANTATLLLVRGARRRRDLAIRAALGASRSRLLFQVLAEAAIIASAGTALALVLGRWFDDAVRGVLLPAITESAGISPRIAAAAALAGLLAFAVAAAAGARQLPGRLRSGDLSGAPGRGSRRRGHRALLVVQTTLSIVLLAGAGVFGRSLYNLVSQDFGMRVQDVLLVDFEPGPGADGRSELFEAALEAVRALPGVDRATAINGLPFAGHNIPPIGVPGRAEPPNVDGQLPFLIPATPEFFDILDIRLSQGRRFTAADERGPLVVIVNETMARTVWPGESAQGKCIRIGFDPGFDPSTATGPPGPPVSVPCREVVGIAHDVRQRSILPDGHEERLMQYYVPFSQVPPPPAGVGAGAGMNIRGLLVKTRVNPDTLMAPVRRLVTAGRTNLPFLRVRAYSDLLERQMQPWRLGTALLSLFGALALAVAAMGLYAAFDQVVFERRREMAIRIAVGARPGAVLRMIVHESAGVAFIGVVCGSIAAVVGGRWVQSLLFETVPYDPIVLVGSAVVMLVVAAAATFVPARNASRADPNSLLRAE
jgi:putative ABC transport system permease protein